jgi:hypothetical protein
MGYRVAMFASQTVAEHLALRAKAVRRVMIGCETRIARVLTILLPESMPLAASTMAPYLAVGCTTAWLSSSCERL